MRRADPHIGLLHRATEKLIEYKTYLQVCIRLAVSKVFETFCCCEDFCVLICLQDFIVRLLGFKEEAIKLKISGIFLIFSRPQVNKTCCLYSDYFSCF